MSERLQLPEETIAALREQWYARRSPDDPRVPCDSATCPCLAVVRVHWPGTLSGEGVSGLLRGVRSADGRHRRDARLSVRCRGVAVSASGTARDDEVTTGGGPMGRKVRVKWTKRAERLKAQPELRVEYIQAFGTRRRWKRALGRTR